VRLLFLFSAILEIVILAVLYLAGHKHVLAGMRLPDPLPKPLPNLPKAALIVPITGDTQAARTGLDSLLSQDYPDLAVVLVTRDEADPATPLARGLIAGKALARHVLAGEAKNCGQKNHNLLAGVRAIGDAAEVYVFCDATHLAKPNLVRLLLEPIAEGLAVLTGGYHRVVPGDFGLGTLGMLHVTLALHCLQPVRAITQPWGGAMAVTREVFEKHGVAQVWARNIVDDYSMGPHLIKQGIRSWPVAQACLETRLSGVTIAQWREWFFRQLQYLKFCTPETWLVSLPVVWSMGATPLMAVAGLGGWLLGLLPAWWALAGLGYLAAFSVMGLIFRTLSAKPVPAWAWTRAFFLSFLMTAWCYLRTWVSFKMSWRGIAYRVTWGGWVEEIIRPETGPLP
jgi:cellulose synthase/poly-beta-1,6-N-acetylglucosamine synthase-like glycosyltransferase